MKYLFWLLVILLVWWAWRRASATRSRQEPSATPQTQDMVTCAHCGVHLPHNEAIAGARGQYCSAAHRSAADDQNPD
jgi:uncharacterized protein